MARAALKRAPSCVTTRMCQVRIAKVWPCRDQNHTKYRPITTKSQACSPSVPTSAWR